MSRKIEAALVGRSARLWMDAPNLTETRQLLKFKARFVKAAHAWDLIPTKEVLNWMRDRGAKLSPNLIEILTREDQAESFKIQKVPRQIKHLIGAPMPYQWEGVDWFERHRGRILLADEMGLGKTLQAITWITFHPELRPAVIVCPGYLKPNWAAEFKKFTTLTKIEVLSSFTGHALNRKGIFIINYEILDAWLPFLQEIEPLILGMDECHYISNKAAQRSKALNSLAKRIPHVFGLSGTPINNRPIELYHAVSLIDPNLFPSFMDYAHRYCDPTFDSNGVQYKGATNTLELHQILTSTIMLRRLKKDVLPELPKKVRSVIPVELENRKEYDAAEKDFISWLKMHIPDKMDQRLKMEAASKINTLRQLAIRGKLGTIHKWVRNYLAEEGKIVVFFRHIEPMLELAKKFDEKIVIYGKVRSEKRLALANEFNAHPRNIPLIGNLMAAGTGLNLTGAHATLTAEMVWSPMIHDQGEDRVHRIGQSHDSVMAYYLMADRTIDTRMMKVNDKKRQIIASIMDGRKVDSSDMLMEVLKDYLSNGP